MILSTSRTGKVIDMPVFMRGNYIFVRPGEKCYEVSSNFTNYLELGARGITKHYLEAKMENDEFRVSGTLLNKEGEVLCRLKDNFIETSEGCIKDMTPHGYRIRDKDGDLVLEIRVEQDSVCHLSGILYEESGEIVAQGINGEFTVMKGPVILGKSGSAIGIRLD